MHHGQDLEARPAQQEASRRRGIQRLLAGLMILALSVALGSSCSAARSTAACDRLQDFSCHCFPLCQLQYNNIIDSQDAQQCEQAVKDAYSYWGQRCTKTCNPNCEYGWGTCAFSHYQEVGENPTHVCGTTKDAGGDGG